MVRASRITKIPKSTAMTEMAMSMRRSIDTDPDDA